MAKAPSLSIPSFLVRGVTRDPLDLCRLDQESVVLRGGPRCGGAALRPLSSGAGGCGARRYDPQSRQPRVLFCGESGPR